MADQDDASGMEQLQAAALTAIRAGQALLQAAEKLVANPESAAQLASTLTVLAKAAMSTVIPASASPADGAAGGATSEGDAPEDDLFEPIDVR